MTSRESRLGKLVARRSPWALGWMGLLAGILFLLVPACGSQSPEGVQAPGASAVAMSKARGLPELCYQVQDMGPAYLNWSEGQTLGINPRGTVVGTTGASGDARRGFIFDEGKLTLLGSLGGDLSDVRAVNARGLAVGGSLTAAKWARATSFYKGTVNDLGTLDGTDSWAQDVNAAGLVVGNAKLNGTYHAVSFHRGQVLDLGTFGGDPAVNTFATGVNEPGDVVGLAIPAPDAYKSFLVPAGGEMVALGTIDGAGTNSVANKVNNGGTVCGWADAPGGRHAFLYRKGAMTDLGPFTTWYSYSECMDVSETGSAVGYFADENWGYHAFVWRNAQEGLVDLNFRIPGSTFDFWLYRASNINSAGQITAYGVKAPTWDFTEGYLLSPVDCP